MAEGSVVIGDLSLFRFGGTRSVFAGAGAPSGPAVETRASGWKGDDAVHGASLLDAPAVLAEAPEWPPSGAAPIVLTRIKPAIAITPIAGSAAFAPVQSRSGAMARSLGGGGPLLALTAPSPETAGVWTGGSRAWVLPRLLAAWACATSGEQPRWVVWGQDHDAMALRFDPDGDSLAITQVRALAGWGARVTLTGLAALIEDALVAPVRAELAPFPLIRGHLRAVSLLVAERVCLRCAESGGTVDYPGPLVPASALAVAPPAVRGAFDRHGVRVAVSLPVAKMRERVDTRGLGAADVATFLRAHGIECLVPAEPELIHPRLVALLRAVGSVSEVSAAEALKLAERGMGGKRLAEAAIPDLATWRRLVIAGPAGWGAIRPGSAPAGERPAADEPTRTTLTPPTVAPPTVAPPLAPVATGPVTTGPVTTGPVTTGPVTTGPVTTGPSAAPRPARGNLFRAAPNAPPPDPAPADPAPPGAASSDPSPHVPAPHVPAPPDPRPSIPMPAIPVPAIPVAAVAAVPAAAPLASLPPWGRFPLTGIPDGRELAVYVDEKRADPATWALERGDADSTACIRFQPGHVPPFDAIVRVDYRPRA